jgi:PKD repeat protein
MTLRARRTAVVAVVPIVLLAVVATLAWTSATGGTSPAAPSGLISAWACPTTNPGYWAGSNVTRGPAPLSVEFCAEANGSAANYTWYFGDGGRAGGQEVSHTYTSPGAYDARVQIQGASFNDSKWVWIYATGGPSVPLQVNLTASATSSGPANGSGLSYGAQVTATISSCRGYCWINWTYSNSTFTSAPVPMNNVGSDVYSFYVAVPHPGNWTIGVTAGDPLGDSGNGSTTVPISAVSGFRVAAIGATPTQGAAPLVTTFFVNFTGAVGNVSAVWSFGDGGNGTGLQVVHTYTSAGFYVATAWLVDSAGDRANGTVGVNVTGNASATRLVLNMTPTSWQGTAPFNATFVGSVAGGYAPYFLNVSFGDGSPPMILHLVASGAQFQIGHPYGSPGNFTVVATLTDSSGATAIVSFPIVVVGNGTPLSATGQSAFTVGPGPVAAGAIVNVSGGTAPYSLEYVWGDGAVSSAVNDGLAVHLYTNPGVYRPFVNVTDAVGRMIRVPLGTVNVTAGNGTTPAGNGGGLVPAGANGWGMVGLAAAVGIGVGIVATVGLTYENRRRSVRKEGEGIARALESEAVTGPARSGPDVSEDVKRE